MLCVLFGRKLVLNTFVDNMFMMGDMRVKGLLEKLDVLSDAVLHNP